MSDAIDRALAELSRLMALARNAPWAWQVAALAVGLLVIMVVARKHITLGWLFFPVLGAAIYWAWLRFRGY